MAFRINSGITAMNANVQSSLNKLGVNRSVAAFSSGFAINKSAYDASGLGIANQLSSQVSGLGQAIQNSNDSIGLVQVADGALQEYTNILEDVRVLTLQASNGTLNNDNRAIIQTQIDSLLQSADDIAKTTRYNSIKLLDGTGGSSNNGTFVSQIGANANETQSVRIGDAQVSSIIAGGIDVSSLALAQSSTTSIDDAIKNITTIRSDLGAAQNKLFSNISNISVTQVNIAAAESQIRDIDFAAESANFSKLNILAQTGSYAQSQANASQASVANLFK
ncbi:MAG: flagellin [Sulfurimonas sp.]|nr:MAG: flagellin [Sulfurimonas sp.]